MLNGFPLLTILIFLPLTGALCLVPFWSRPGSARRVALAMALLELVLAGGLFPVITRAAHSPGTPLFLFREDHSWIAGIGARYTLGMDGISYLLVLLTAFITVVAMLVSWQSIGERIALHYLLLLVMESGIMGVFL